MDGRVQLQVNDFLKNKFNVEYVDTITEPGPNLILSDQKNTAVIDSIMHRLDISVRLHNSVGLAVVGHFGCAGNPAEKNDQLNHIENSISFLKEKYPEIPIVGLWVDDEWKVNEVF